MAVRLFIFETLGIQLLVQIQVSMVASVTCAYLLSVVEEVLLRSLLHDEHDWPALTALPIHTPYYA